LDGRPTENRFVSPARFILVVTALLLAPAIASGQAPGSGEPPPQGAVSQEARDALNGIIRRQEALLIAAIAAKDRSALERLIWQDFVLRQEPVSDRDGWIEENLRLCGGGRAEIHSLDIKVFAEAAIASLSVTLHRDPLCQPPSSRLLITDVWTLRDGEWRLSMRQAGPLAVPGASPSEPTPLPAATRQWAGSAELSLLTTTGNVETQTIGVGGELVWQRGPWRTLGRSTFVRTKTNGIERARSVNAEVRQSRALLPWFDLFGRATYQRDLFSGIINRYGGDAGMGLRFAYHGHSIETTLGGGTAREVRLAGNDRYVPQATAGVRYRWAVSASMAITDDLNYAKSLRASQNWRADNTASISATLRRPFSLRLSHVTKYVRQPVLGFERTDMITSAAVVARF
jgi:putative salt-induced outer membrane protein YdiY